MAAPAPKARSAMEFTSCRGRGELVHRWQEDCRDSWEVLVVLLPPCERWVLRTSRAAWWS